MPRTPSGWKILVATDGSEDAERAVTAAARLPWPDGSEVRLLTVVDRLDDMPETLAAHRTRAETTLAAARRRIEKAGRTASSTVLSGTVTRVILDTASEWGATIIVTGARGLGPVRGMFLGSVSSAVARAAHCSVLVVETDLKMPLRVVLAVDGSAEARTAARRLAEMRGDGGAVTVLRVIEPPAARSLGLLPRRAAAAIRGELAHATEELRRTAEAEVGEVAGLLRKAGWKADGVVKAGIPLREILALAKKTSASVVAIGPRGATGLERLLLGSVAEGLLASPGISVFIGR